MPIPPGRPRLLEPVVHTYALGASPGAGTGAEAVRDNETGSDSWGFWGVHRYAAIDLVRFVRIKER